jgi:hypothetical protein
VCLICFLAAIISPAFIKASALIYRQCGFGSKNSEKLSFLQPKIWA